MKKIALYSFLLIAMAAFAGCGRPGYVAASYPAYPYGYAPYVYGPVRPPMMVAPPRYGWGYGYHGYHRHYDRRYDNRQQYQAPRGGDNYRHPRGR
jgi:hypothetical protein